MRLLFWRPADDDGFMTDEEFAEWARIHLRRVRPLARILDVCAPIMGVLMIWNWAHGEEPWYEAIPVLAIVILWFYISHGEFKE
jgi:hypothetical protein